MSRRGYAGFAVFPEALRLIVADLAAAGAYDHGETHTMNDRSECPIGTLCRLTGIARGLTDNEGRFTEEATRSIYTHLTESETIGLWQPTIHANPSRPGVNVNLLRLGVAGRRRDRAVVSLMRFARKHDHNEITDYHRALGVAKGE